jgi:hypothetical protein
MLCPKIAILTPPPVGYLHLENTKDQRKTHGVCDTKYIYNKNHPFNANYLLRYFYEYIKSESLQYITDI